MLYVITPDGNYYEGYEAAIGSTHVPQRPGGPEYQWQGAAGWVNVGLSKEARIAQILATQGKGRDRTTIQISIQLAELIATIQAPAYGMTVAEAIAYAYTKNTTYRESKDTEAAIRVVELAP